MAKISNKAMQEALAEFVDKQVLPAAEDSSFLMWLIPGAAAVFISKIDTILEPFKGMMEKIGLIDEEGNYNVDEIEKFLSASFKKQESFKIPLVGKDLNFTEKDADALITFMNKRAE